MTGQEFHTLQEFYLHSKTLTYVLMGLVLIGFLGFWRLLTGRQEDVKKTVK
jgi:hypothetical protein